MLRQGDERAYADPRHLGGRPTHGRIGRDIGCGYPDRAPTPIGQPDDHVSRAASGALVGKHKSLAKQRMLRVRNRYLRYDPIENGGILRCSASPPSPMPSWIGSSITPIASDSKATACVGPELNKTRRLDQTSSPGHKTFGQRGSRPGRHHSVTVRGIIQESRAPLSRYTRATSSESAPAGRIAGSF